MKKILCIILSILILTTTFTTFTLSSLAADENNIFSGEYLCGDFKYKLTSSATACITGYSGASADLEIPEVIDDYTVTHIGTNAFSKLTSITLPSTINHIEGGAFSYCNTLKDVYIKDLSAWLNIDFEDYDSNPLIYATNLYLNNSLLTSVTIPQGTTTIPNYAFRNYKILTTVTIPDTVITIGEAAFEGCTSLGDVTFPNSIRTIGSYAFSNCYEIKTLTLPDGVETLGDSCFSACRNLKEISLPDSITSIGLSPFKNTVYYQTTANRENGVLYINNHLIDADESIKGEYTVKEGTKTLSSAAFRFCSSLTKVNLPDSLISIPDSAFEDCSGISEINLPSTVKSIGDYAFYYCESLTSVTIPDSVTSIGHSAFEDCCELINISLSDNITSISDLAFLNTAYYGDTNNWENGVLYINNYLIEAESNVSGLYKVKDGTKTIADCAFIFCKELTDAIIPESVVTIGKFAFDNCNKGKNITIYNPECVIKDKSISKFINIYGYNNSTAHKYAIETDQNFVDLTLADKHIWRVNIVKHASCTEDGVSEHLCILCGEYRTLSIDSTGHFFDMGVITTAPACNKKGEKTFTCRKCNTTTTEELLALTHSTKTVNIKKATYFAKGHTGIVVCNTCNCKISNGKATAKLKLKTPAVKVTGAKKKLTVKYTKVKGATGFQVKYKVGKKTVKKTFETKKTMKKVFKNLKKGNYNVQIRALIKQNSKTAYSSWTKAKTVKVK